VTAANSRHKTFEKTISFFRLADARDGSPVEHVDWSARIAGIGPDVLRRVATTRDIDGAVVVHSDRSRIVLSRDRGNAPRQQDSSSGKKQDLSVRGANWNVIEEGFVTFLDIGNVFAFARSSAIAPQASRVAEWLNATGIVPNLTWEAQPLIDPERYERLRQEGGVTMVDVVGRPGGAAADSGSSLVRAISGLRDLGDVKIEVKVTVTRGRQNREEQQRLRDQALALLGVIGQHDYPVLESAKVKKIGDPDPIDLIEHHVSSKRTVSLALGDTNRSLNEHVVFDASDSVITESLPTVRRILGH
jgi:hypothetical protein